MGDRRSSIFHNLGVQEIVTVKFSVEPIFYRKCTVSRDYLIDFLGHLLSSTPHLFDRVRVQNWQFLSVREFSLWNRAYRSGLFARVLSVLFLYQVMCKTFLAPVC